jgi:hypothetical protein
MTMNLRRVSAALAATTALLFFAGIAEAKPASKWRVTFDHAADNDGTLVLRIAPEGGTPIDVETKVPAKTTENAVAKLVRDAMKVALGKGYGIETDDGESVIVKRKGKTPKFDLTLASNSLTGLDIKIKNQ